MFKKAFSNKLATLFLAPLTLMCAQVASAQTTGSIEGTVTDVSQAAIPNVVVKVVNQATRVNNDIATNSTGYFRAENLPVGVYDISVNQQGFKTYSIQGIRLDIAARVRHDIALEVGNLTETVTVKASPVEVQTSNGTVSAVITREQIATAVLNGRHYARLAMLMPGAVYSSGSDELSGAGLSQVGSPVSINGLNNKASGWFVDGAFNINFGNGEANTHVPVIETLEEVQVQTSNYNARYGTAGGSIINAVTRSGTNTFHGALYEYLRNDKLDARNFFQTTKPPIKQNQFGFTFGGPVILPKYNGRNKTFFFYSEDWRKRRTPAVALLAVPTVAMRGGDFAAEAARLKLPILDPDTKQPFLNNFIPANRINANAALLLKTYFPLPNYSAEGVFQNYINNGVAVLDPRTDTGKLDHNLGDRIRLSFTISNDEIPVLSANGGQSGSPLDNIRQLEATTGLTGNARADFIISPRSTNDFSYSFKKYNVILHMQDAGAPQARPSGLAIKDFYSGANTLNLAPQLTFAQGYATAGTFQLPLDPATDDNFVLTDNFSHVAGKHTLQAGGSLFHFNKTQAIFNTTQGSYNFSGNSTNSAIGDFLLGLARTYTEGKERFVRTYTFSQTEWYAQDDWRVSRKLTLNLGARLYIIPLAHEAQDRISSFLPERFDPAKAPIITSAGILTPTANYDPLNGLVFPRKNGVPRSFVDPFIGFAPRFGFAYDPRGNGKMAIRGGYGISYLNIGNDQNGMANNPPFSATASLQNVSLDDPSSGTPNALAPIALNAFSPNFERPMIQSWSLTGQKELPGQFLATAGYVGTRGTNFEVWIDRNSTLFGAATPGFDFDPRINAGTNTNPLRPFQGYATITQFNSGLSSVYHSLQTTFQRRFANGLALQGTYTFSKAIGESQTARNPTPQNILNWRADRGPVDFDRTHVFSMNYIYDIPGFRHRRNVLGQVLGNWQLSGFITMQSGLALTPGLSISGAGLATRPNATGASVEGDRTKESWFNTAAFAAPAVGRFGNSGVGVIRGPGFVIWDSAVRKEFPLSERTKVTFSSEFYNFLNHANWSGVSTAFGGGTFGRITSARDPRKVQLGLRLDF